MGKHTPGPWSHDADHEQTWHPKIKTDPEVFAGAICEVLSNLNVAASDRRMFDEMKANARLIAAAPDLLEALTDALEDYDAWMKDADVTPNESLQAWTNKARAAIARARGEA